MIYLMIYLFVTTSDGILLISDNFVFASRKALRSNEYELQLANTKCGLLKQQTFKT
jgi:hypothetical protein